MKRKLTAEIKNDFCKECKVANGKDYCDAGAKQILDCFINTEDCEVIDEDIPETIEEVIELIKPYKNVEIVRTILGEVRIQVGHYHYKFEDRYDFGIELSKTCYIHITDKISTAYLLLKEKAEEKYNFLED